MLDPDIAVLMGSPSPMPALDETLLAALRASMATVGAALPKAEVADVRDFHADGVPVRLYRPALEPNLPLLVFLHGGGWMLGDLDSHDAMNRLMAVKARCAVLAVGYRLAPEHRFPAALDDVSIAFAWARREAMALGCDPARVAIGGESAGGNLSAALTLALRDAGQAQPLFQLLVHPVTDLTFDFPSIDEVAAAGLSRDYLEACIAFYAGGANVMDPLISPLHAAQHDGLAPAIVVTAAEDPLRDDGEQYGSKLAAAGVETLIQRLPFLPHGFLFLPATIPAVDRAFELIARLIRRYFAAD